MSVLKRNQTLFLIALFIALISCNFDKKGNKSNNDSNPNDREQTLYFGGDIITMDGETLQYVETVVQEDGKIVFVGLKADAEKQYANVTPYDLKGKTLIPGFIEPHLHPMIAAVVLSGDIVAPYDWNLPDGVKKGVQGHDAFIDRLKNQ